MEKQEYRTDAGDGQGAGKGSVRVKAEHARQGDLLDQPLEHEVDFGEGDGEAAAAGLTGDVGRGRGRGG